jgi:hypothetical protein
VALAGQLADGSLTATDYKATDDFCGKLRPQSKIETVANRPSLLAELGAILDVSDDDLRQRLLEPKAPGDHRVREQRSIKR